MDYKNWPVPDNLVMFRGGCGGNFITSSLYKHLFPKDDYHYEFLYDTVQNEYQFWTNHFDWKTPEIRPILDQTHLNVWFKPTKDTEYGSEIYTKARYRDRLQAYKNTNIIMIQPGLHNIAYTEHLGKMKTLERSGVLTTSKEAGVQGVNPHVYTYIEDVVRHYKFASWIMRKSGINVLDVDYGQLMKFDTKNQVTLICKFLKKPYTPAIALDCVNYSKYNQQLMDQYGYGLQLKPLT